MDRKCTVCGKEITHKQWRLTDENNNGDLCKSCWDDCWERVINEAKEKEVKKVKKEIDYKKIKYWDVKVVKVKRKHNKRREVWNKGNCFIPTCSCNSWVSFENTVNDTVKSIQCGKCGNYYKQGNFVNGENIDKIKFPCLCSYSGGLGMIIARKYGEKKYNYQIISIDQQGKSAGGSDTWFSLENMINAFNIHILKGRITVFSEEVE